MKTTKLLLLPFFILFISIQSFSQITDNEKQNLIFTAQEEKVAFDFYTAMFAKWNEKVFENVMTAEKSHLEHVQGLMNEYGIVSEGILGNAGEYSNKDLQSQYDVLIKTGGYSFTDALIAAARYEEQDISDLKKFYTPADNEKVKALFECLGKASQNHLRAFVKNLKREGINFKPTILSAEEFNSIISSKNEPGDCFGTGN